MDLYPVFQNAEDYINCLLAGIIVLSCYWYLISKRRRVLAELSCNGKSKRVYKLDNSVSGWGFADIRLKKEKGRYRRAYLNADIKNSVPRGWKLSIKGEKVKNLTDGDSIDIYGRSYVFHSRLGTHKAYRGHFIPIILIAAFSLLIQLYFSIYASFEYANINPNFSISLPSAITTAALLDLARNTQFWYSPLGLFTFEVILLVIVSIFNSRRLTPEVIIFFFLSFMGYLLFPGDNALIYIASGWVFWCIAPPLLKRPLVLMDKLLKNSSKKVLGLILTFIAVIALIFASLIVDGNDIVPDPAQIQQIKVFSAAGGHNGLGLYNGLFRDEGTQNGSGFVIGTLFEELGFLTGIMCLFLILLTAYGCYFQGVRAERYYLAVLCFLAAGVIGLRAMLSVISITGPINIMGVNIILPPLGTPTPFLSQNTASGIMLFAGMALVESVKLSWRIKPSPVTIVDTDSGNLLYQPQETAEEIRVETTDVEGIDDINDSGREPVPVSTAESESGE